MIEWIVIGAGLGFILEGAGFGNPKKLTGVFLLRDWAVPQVMMTAIVTAMACGLIATLFGIDTGAWFVPVTRYAGQAVGGLIFGVGFFLGGYCPGTAMVGAASGRADALAFLGGLFGGWFLWDAFGSHAKALLEKVPRDRDTLPEVFSLNPTVLGLIFVVVGGAVLFWFYRRTPTETS